MLMYVGIACLAMSLAAFILYGRDKRLAKRRQWRIPEKVLLWVGFLGGSPGALLGMHCFRHKTRHWYFWAVNIAGLIWQGGLLAFCIWKAVFQGQ